MTLFKKIVPGLVLLFLVSCMGHHNVKEQNGQFADLRSGQASIEQELAAMNVKMAELMRRLAAFEANANPQVAPAETTAGLGGESITRVSDYKYQIPRSVIDAIHKEPTRIARGCRIVPSLRDGKANGFKLYAIRPNSVWEGLGFKNGDTIHSINGNDLNTPDMALHTYSSLKEATNFMVRLTRQGKPVVIEIAIVDQT